MPSESKSNEANLLSMRMETGVRKALSFVFAEEPAIFQAYVVNFISGAPAV